MSDYLESGKKQRQKESQKLSQYHCTMKKWLFIFCLSICINGMADNYLAAVWGIKGDGTTDNTSSIQRAINWISQQGGGILFFPVGQYLTAPIEMKDSVVIQLMEGAVLRGVDNEYAYSKHKSLIYGNSIKGCDVIGNGRIICRYNSVTLLSCTKPDSISENMVFHRQQINDSIIYASTFGIKSNSSTLNTRAIQYAIDFIAERGGGTLCFQVGRYLTGTIHMRDNVNIELGSGAILVASDNPLDYDPEGKILPLIEAKSVSNCKIYGIGVIEGNGSRLNENLISLTAKGVLEDDLTDGKSKYKQVLLHAKQSQNIEITNLNLRTPGWVAMYYDSCENIKMEKLTADAHLSFLKTYVSTNSNNLQDNHIFLNRID